MYANGRPTRAADLNVGDAIVVLGPDGKPRSDTIRSLESFASAEETFDLTVAGSGLYFANFVLVIIKPL